MRADMLHFGIFLRLGNKSHQASNPHPSSRSTQLFLLPLLPTIPYPNHPEYLPQLAATKSLDESCHDLHYIVTSPLRPQYQRHTMRPLSRNINATPCDPSPASASPAQIGHHNGVFSATSRAFRFRPPPHRPSHLKSGCAATRRLLGAENGCQVEENGFLDFGRRFSRTNCPGLGRLLDSGARWGRRSADELIGVRYLVPARDKRPALLRHPKMAALPSQIRRPEQQIEDLRCNWFYRSLYSQLGR
ncbi:hypothetical protein VTI28DRAFT_4478 [Corynascus sepedonium]